ncbi:MAG: hypothetical protein JXJ04_00010 [Spirochaetales bacterium]|nr:hypothetical protein [Spirochaetales bacterium]
MRRVVRIFLVLSVFFLFQPLFAQKIILEYYQGRELVVYTPDYKLILLEELTPGNEIPVGSIIETGRKSTCELKCLPSGIIIKIGDRTTFKIEELQGSDFSGKNGFKLMDGAIRAVTSKKTGQENHVFLNGSSGVYPENADFGMTVKKGWEEKIFVLEGTVKYANAQGVEIMVSKDQMANGLDETLKAEPMSVRMKRLANTLAFSYLKPGEVDNTRENYPVQTAIPTEPPPYSTDAIPVVTPQGTYPPEAESTPVPSLPPESTPYEAITATPEPVVIYGDTESEKSASPLDPDREELYPADAYAFTAQYNYSYDFRIDEVGDEYVTISYALPEKDETAKKEGIPEAKEEGTPETEEESNPEAKEPPVMPEYTLYEVYDVYEQKENLKGKDVYAHFIDSVFLEKVEDRIFYFSFLWRGAKKNIKPGYFLYPTGRLFSFDEDTIVVLPEEESGDEAIEGEEEITEGEHDFPDQSGQAKKRSGDGNKSDTGLFIDTGFSITVGFFNLDTGLGGDVDFFANLLLMLVSARGHSFLDTTFKFTSWFGIGAELGFAAMYLEDIYYLDFPLRGYLRFGTRDFYIQPYCGYYFSFFLWEKIILGPSGVDGLDVGLSVSLGGFYLEGSYVIGEIVGQLNYFRAGIGFVINDIF